jgi:hypothetical protein
MYSQVQFGSQQVVSSAWAAFSQKLSLVLDGLAEGDDLILNENCSVQFVQFHARGDGSKVISSETTSNFHRSEYKQLCNEQIAQLIALGWRPPNVHPGNWAVTDEPYYPTVAVTCGPFYSASFFAIFPLPLNCKSLADMAVRTFAQVLRVESPRHSLYDAYDWDGKRFSLPQLGLKRFKY